MELLHIESTRPDRAATGTALFALGFRPFFLVAGVAAVVLPALWVLDYTGVRSLATSYPTPALWHAHEMIFGYTAAVIAGFLLTAVRNWTGVDTPRGAALAALVGLWLAARLTPLLPAAIPAVWVAALDLSFFPALALALAPPLVRQGRAHNLIFLPILGALAVANALVHLEVLGDPAATARAGLYLAVDLVVLIIAVIGGRVIPFFTERALPGARPRRRRVVEALALGSLVALAAVEPFATGGGLALGLALVAAAAHAVRLWGWYDARIWRVPLLWVLHVGYAWVAVGFALHALAAAGWIPPRIAVHAFTAGAIGSLTLGMMARVALGHTGRPLQPAPIMTVAFALVAAAALVRVAGGMLAPDAWYVPLIALAGGLWIASFAIFVAVYAPILVRPRPDGAPG